MSTVSNNRFILSPTPALIATSKAAHVCPDCGGNFLVEAGMGLTCATCGLVVDETPAFDARVPLGRNGIILHRELFHAHVPTLIGSRQERTTAPIELVRASRYAADFRSLVLRHGAAEVRGILATLGVLTPSLLDACYATFSALYAAMPPRSPLRNVNILALVAVFRTAQARGITVQAKEVRALLIVSEPTDAAKRQALFRTALQVASAVLPHPEPHRALLARVSALASLAGIPADVTATAARACREYGFKFSAGSKPAVAAAGVIAAAILAHDLRGMYTISRIAEVAGVATSAVSRCIARACVEAGIVLPKGVAESGRVIATWLNLSSYDPTLRK